MSLCRRLFKPGGVICFIRFIRSISVSCLLLVASSQVLAGSYDDLLNAMKLNDLPQVLKSLRRGMDVNTADKSGNTLLMTAARNGQIEILDQLLALRANVRATNRHGDTALMLAALNGHLRAVQKLVQAGSALDPQGWTPLIYATFNGHLEVMKFLLVSGAAIDAQASNGMTALMAACRNGYPDAVRLLLARGADVRRSDQAGRTALEFAIAAKNEDIAQWLRQAGAGE